MATATLLQTVDQTMMRFAGLSYRFQTQRFTLARRLSEYQAVCRRCNIPTRPIERSSLPLYTVARRGGGPLRIVRRSGIAGGADIGPHWTLTLGVLETLALAGLFASIFGFVRVVTRPPKQRTGGDR